MRDNRKPIDPSTIIFDPTEAREATTNAVLQARADFADGNHGIALGIKCLDMPSNLTPEQLAKAKYLLPLRRTQFVPVIGRPRAGKTQFMLNAVYHHAEELAAAGIVNHANVVISWEQSIEEMGAYGLARDTGISLSQIAMGSLSQEEVELVKGYCIRRAGDQIFHVGFSDTIQARRPPMTMEVVYKALEMIRDWNGVRNSFILDIVMLDYLQRIPFDDRESKTVGISHNVDLIKDLAMQFSCVALTGSQAKQQVDVRDDKMPEASDSEYTDNMFQSGDVILSVMSPALYYEPGDIAGGIALNKEMLDDLMFIRVCKQKKGRSEFLRAILFDRAHCRYIGDVITKEVV